MRSTIIALVSSTLFLSVPVHAQQLASLQIGTRIRVQSSEGHNTVGTFVATSADGLTLNTEHERDRIVPMEAIRKVEVSRGRSHGRGLFKGAVLGIASGIVTGAAVGYLSWKDEPGGNGKYGNGICIFSCSRGASTAGGITIFTPLAFLVGSVIGAARGSETWEPLASH